jgi:hypothetical protein
MFTHYLLIPDGTEARKRVDCGLKFDAIAKEFPQYIVIRLTDTPMGFASFCKNSEGGCYCIHNNWDDTN